MLAPKNVRQVQAMVMTNGASLASEWYLADVDSLAKNGVNPWTNSVLTPRPVHGSVRNAVYFDGHVGNKKVNPAGGWYN